MIIDFRKSKRAGKPVEKLAEIKAMLSKGK